jgi:hypothetical protein
MRGYDFLPRIIPRDSRIGIADGVVQVLLRTPLTQSVCSHCRREAVLRIYRTVMPDSPEQNAEGAAGMYVLRA